jgi:GntR family transcriptional regulator
LVKRAGRTPYYMQVADALREEVIAGRVRPGDQLPSERELRERFRVSTMTVRAAIDQLRAEGLVISRQGAGSFVREQTVPRRLSTDIATSTGWYHTLARQGLTPSGQTTVRQEPASAEAAEWLAIDPGTPITIRDRVLGTKGEPPTMLAASHFPKWVTDAAPALADPSRGGMPEILREAFGETYSTDVITCRMPAPDERDRLDLDPGMPVLVILGGTYDSQRRPLHFIRVVAPSGRSEFAYVYGTVPADSSSGDAH